jgi:hypothetical protein
MLHCCLNLGSWTAVRRHRVVHEVRCQADGPCKRWYGSSTLQQSGNIFAQHLRNSTDQQQQPAEETYHQRQARVYRHSFLQQHGRPYQNKFEPEVLEH